MSVSDGQKGNASNFNTAFMSRNAANTDTTSKVDLLNTDTASGSTVTNTQRELNSQASQTGAVPGAVKDAKPTWTNNDIGTTTDDIRTRADTISGAIVDKADGASSSTDNAVPRFDGLLGKTLQNSGVLIDDSDNVTGVEDLTVNGTLTAQDTNILGSTITATDPNIEINSGGNQATADDVAGLKATMTDATDVNLVLYDKDAASLVKAGEVGSEVELANISSSQVITNKDYDGGTATSTNRTTLASDTTTNLNALPRKAGTVYFDTTKQLPVYDDGVVLQDIGSGAAGAGGGGGFSYFNDSAAAEQNPNFENAATGISGYQAYADAAGVLPVDGTGGSPVSTIARTTVAGEFGRQTAGLKFSKDAANRQSEGFNWGPQASERINLYEADQGKQMFINFEYNTSVGYVTDEVEIFVYDHTNSEVITVNGNNDFNGRLTQTGGVFRRFSGSFFTKSDTTEFRFIVHVRGTSAVAYDIFFDDFSMGPAATLQIPNIGDSVDFNPNWTNLTLGNGTEDWSYEIIGPLVHIKGNTVFGSTTSITGSVTMDNPVTGFGNLIRPAGTLSGAVCGYYDASTAANREVGTAHAFSGDTIRFQSFTLGNLSSTVPFTWAVNDSIALDAWFVLSEASTGSTLTTNQANLQSQHVEATVSSASHTSSGSWQDVAWTETEDTHNSFDGTTWTVPINGVYTIQASVSFVGNATGQAGIRVAKGGTAFVVGDVDKNNSVATNGVGVVAAVKLVAGDTIKIQAFQDSGGSLSYTLATESKFTIISHADLTVIGVNGVQEYISAEVANAQATVTADTYIDADSASADNIDLSPGTWDLGYDGTIEVSYVSGGLSFFYGNAVITDSSNNLIADTVSIVGANLDATQNFVYAGVSRKTRITITANTTYKLRVRSNKAAAVGIARVQDNAISGTLTDDDNNSILWARRVS